MKNEIKNLVLQKAGLYIETKTVFSYPIHSHSYYEMTLYMPFEGSIRINDNKYSVDTPFISLIAPSDFHIIEVLDSGNAEVVKLSFDADVLDKGLRESGSTVLRDIAQNDALVTLFYEIRRGGDSKYSRFLLNALVCALCNRGEAVTNNKVSASFSFLKAATLKISSDFRENLTLESIAEELGITPQYLSRLFCQKAGLGFSAYLTKTRLERAALYLAETNTSVTEIAYEVGYRDLSHFMRSFKKHYGVTPLAYKKCKKANENGVNS